MTILPLEGRLVCFYCGKPIDQEEGFIVLLNGEPAHIACGRKNASPEIAAYSTNQNAHP